MTLKTKTAVASYEPQKPISVVVEGDLGATVGMVAVDNAVYILNNKNRLTQKKVNFYGVYNKNLIETGQK